VNLSDLVLVAISVDREPRYVHQTLASMFMADPIV